MYTITEGKDFVLERLYRGSVLNYHTFFQEQYNGELYMRFATQSILKSLTLKRMEQIAKQFPKLE